MHAPGVSLAYLEHVSLAQGGGRAKTKVETRIQPISLLRFTWREANASSNITPVPQHHSFFLLLQVELFLPDDSTQLQPLQLAQLPADSFHSASR